MIILDQIFIKRVLRYDYIGEWQEIYKLFKMSFLEKTIRSRIQLMNYFFGKVKKNLEPFPSSLSTPTFPP